MPSSACKKSARSEEHTSELQSHDNLVCRLLLEKKSACRSRQLPRSRSRSRWCGFGLLELVGDLLRDGVAKCVGDDDLFFNYRGPPLHLTFFLHALLPT